MVNKKWNTNPTIAHNWFSKIVIMFRKRSKSLDRAKASSRDSLHVSETVDKQEQEARITEYEALIDTLTQKIS